MSVAATSAFSTSSVGSSVQALSLGPSYGRNFMPWTLQGAWSTWNCEAIVMESCPQRVLGTYPGCPLQSVSSQWDVAFGNITAENTSLLRNGNEYTGDSVQKENQLMATWKGKVEFIPNIIVHHSRPRLESKALKPEGSQVEVVGYLKAHHDKPHCITSQQISRVRMTTYYNK